MTLELRQTFLRQLGRVNFSSGSLVLRDAFAMCPGCVLAAFR